MILEIYVVTSRALRNYLNSLDFANKTDKDRNNKEREVYLFEKTEDLLKAITFYSQFKSKRRIKTTN